MKNLPATIGLMIVLFVFFLFQGNADHTVQANPMNQDELVTQAGYQELRQDTLPPKMRDTISPARKAKKEKKEMKEMKKDMKKHQRDSAYKKDSIM
ncbi:hypothetical protein SAMN04488128_103263 [Chitinophaga eiseniae]|uniref:Uncharacterized protein n=1 Tax=Chitinophaga eiseniae TaxID=634771 RepID=A0A1T4SQY9_9BACT|nr:hypothetical protein [Chitinophaga eiseniae]SKA30291.1 hypothetical protein SAMN04488128_103263 [Chitinophaga eiseniae]